MRSLTGIGGGRGIGVEAPTVVCSASTYQHNSIDARAYAKRLIYENKKQFFRQVPFRKEYGKNFFVLQKTA